MLSMINYRLTQIQDKKFTTSSIKSQPLVAYKSGVYKKAHKTRENVLLCIFLTLGLGHFFLLANHLEQILRGRKTENMA